MESSHLLSNFKLFSKPNNSTTTTATTSSHVQSTYLIGIFIFIGAIAIMYFYFYKIANNPDLKQIPSFLNFEWFKSAINTWLGSMWLSTHLAPNGDLTSTYVPSTFLSTAGFV